MKYIFVAFLLGSNLGGCDSTSFLRRTADDSNNQGTTESEFRFPNVEIPLFGKNVVEGYASCDDLLADITVALKVLANKKIESGKKMKCTYYYQDDYQYDDDDDDMYFPEGASIKADYDYAAAASYGGGGGVNSFDTNNQVNDVDEADGVKANEDYIFMSYGNEVVVTDTKGQVLLRADIPPPPKLAGDDENNYFQQTRDIKGLLLDGNILTVVTEFYSYTSNITAVGDGSSTTIFLYEFEGSKLDSTLTLRQQIDINGAYSSARMISGSNHIVMTANVNTYQFTAEFDRCNDIFRTTPPMSDKDYEEEAFRIASDTVDSYAEEIMNGLNLATETENDTSCKDIVRIFQQHKDFPKSSTEDDDTWFMTDPDDVLTSFVQILSFKGSDVLTGNDVTLTRAGTFLPTWRTQLYAANDLLAIAGTGYRNYDNVTILNDKGKDRIYRQVASEYTFVITFDLDGRGATPAAAGEVEGSIYGQFSMDYYENHLRMATTSGAKYGLFPLKDGHREWTQLEDSKSRVSVLQKQEGGELVTVGFLDDLGVGDTINSVRLLGERGYISSWDDDTPLYVLDLSTPTNPVVAGTFNIPNNDLDYMHPLENGTKLLSVGSAFSDDKDSYQSIGLYISLLNVIDSSNPYEEQAYVFETNGSSEALYDHHAFRFIPEINKLIIPGYTYDWQKKDFFDGTWLFDIDAVTGISHAGSVKHAGMNDMTNWYCWNPETLPSRSMVFNNTLVTMQSHSIVMTNDVNTVSTGSDEQQQAWDINLDEGRDETKYDDCATYGNSNSW